MFQPKTEILCFKKQLYQKEIYVKNIANRREKSVWDKDRERILNFINAVRLSRLDTC